MGSTPSTVARRQESPPQQRLLSVEPTLGSNSVVSNHNSAEVAEASPHGAVASSSALGLPTLPQAQPQEQQQTPLGLTTRPQALPQEQQQKLSSAVHAVAKDAQDIVQQCWRDVKVRCSRPHPFDNRPKDNARSSGWPAVRVFVSSTFRDFFDERDILVKKVFPELSEWCEERQIEIIECDLRWGVPKDTNTIDTILTCFNEVERCYHETDGEPFFIGLVGDRYGWVPSEDQLTNQLLDEYQWVKNSSITFMEFLLGAIWPCSKNAAFFIRAYNFVNMLPAKQASTFTETSDLANHHLTVLKAELRRQFHPLQLFDYSVTVDSSQSDSKVTLRGLEAFAAQVLVFLKTAIEKKYPVTAIMSQPTPDHQDSELQSTYIHKLLEKYDFSREAELSILEQYALDKPGSKLEGEGIIKHGPDAEFTTSEEFGAWSSSCGIDLSWNPHLLLSTKGYGYLPDALLAQLLGRLQSEEDFERRVFAYFEQSAPTFQYVTSFLRRLSSFLNCEVMGEDWVGNQTSYKEAMELLVKHMVKTSARLTLILSLNETSTFMSNWFPPALPNGCRCVVVFTKSLSCVARAWLGFGCYELQLGSLPSASARSYVTSFFGKYNKRLDTEQTSLLLGNEGSEKPLWLAVTCEDLRRFGDFRLVTTKISSYPTDIESLLSQILKQLVREDETGGFEKAVCILFCCGALGIRQVDMSRLLKTVAVSETNSGHAEANAALADQQSPLLSLNDPVSKLEWAKIYRNLRSYLQTWYSYEGNRPFETYKISTPELLQTVQSSFLTDPNILRDWHVKIGNYYTGQHSHNFGTHSFDAAAQQYSEANMKDRLLKLCRGSRLTDYRPRRDYLQQMRCWRLHGGGTPTAGFSSVDHSVRLCIACSIRSGGFSALLHNRNSDSCVVCGARVFGQRNATVSDQAQLCTHHAISRRHPGACFLCTVPLPRPGPSAAAAAAPPHSAPTVMRLCHMCIVGRPPNTCCYLEA